MPCPRSRSPRMSLRRARSRPISFPPRRRTLLALNEAAEADRAKRVGDLFGAAFPGVVQYTTDVLFRDLWLRPGLAPRDRSLVTISSLVASGQVAQLTGHLNIGMNNGLTQTGDRGSDHASRLLCRLAERVLGDAGGEGRVRETSALISGRSVNDEEPSMNIGKRRPVNRAVARCDHACALRSVINRSRRRWPTARRRGISRRCCRYAYHERSLLVARKYAHLPRAISEHGKRMRDYAVGIIGYWPPGPDVAIFYRQDGERIPDPGLIVLGKIKAGVEALNAPRRHTRYHRAIVRVNSGNMR